MAVSCTARSSTASPTVTAAPSREASARAALDRQPRERTATRTVPGATKAVSLSRHESDTVDLLQAAAAPAHQVDGGIAQEARTAAARRVLEHADRLARHDHLAQLVGERHDLGDRGAAL